MTRARLVAALLLVHVPLFALSVAAADLPYLFQQLNNRVYKSSFDALFRGEKNLAPWLRGYLKNRNGVDTPGQMVEADGMSYELYEVCEPHNCPGNYIYVLTTPGGSKAWALFTRDGGNYRFFGKPDQQQQALLMTAATQ
jgi:Inhibitor of vertebrate lysozyme (Ivy)